MTPIERRLASLEQQIISDNRVTEISLNIVAPVLGPDGTHERWPDGKCKTRTLETRLVKLNTPSNH